MKSVRAKCFSSTVERAPRKNNNTENYMNSSVYGPNSSKPVQMKTQENDQHNSARLQKPLKVIDIFAVESRANKMRSDSQVNIKALPPIPAYLFPNPNQKKAYSVNVKTSGYTYKVKAGQDFSAATQRMISPVCPNQTISARENNFNPNQIKSSCSSAVTSQTNIKEELTVEGLAKYEHLSILKKRKSKARPNSEVAPKLNYFINAIHRTDFANPFEKRRRMLNVSQESPSIENSLLEKHNNSKIQEAGSFQRYKNCHSSPVKIKRDPSLSLMEPDSLEYKHMRTSSMRESFYSRPRADVKIRPVEDFENSLKLFEKSIIKPKIVIQEQENLFTQQSDANDLNEYVDMRKNTPLDLIEFSRRY